MIEFDENLNPIEGGRPTEDLPPVYQGPASSPEEGPAWREPEPSRPTPPPPPPQQPIWQTPPPAPREPRGRGLGIALTWLVGLVIVCVFAVAALAVYRTTGTGSTTPNQPEGITVTGEGISYATADIAKIQFGVQETAGTVNAVRDQLDSKISKVKNALDNLNIADKDIKTVEYSLYPERDYRYNPPRITGYTGRHSYLVTIRNLDKVNDVVDAITKAGVNDIGNVAFDIDNPDQWVQEARVDAIKEAKDKAQSIADEAEIKLGKLVSIQEYVSGGIEPYPYRYDGMGGGEEPASPSIEPGSQEIHVTVTLVYKIS